MSNIITLFSILGFGYLGHKVFDYINHDEKDSVDKRSGRILTISFFGIVGSVIAPIFIGIKDDITKKD